MLAQVTYPSGSGGGGGGITITGWSVETFTQLTNFTAGSVVLTLAHTPISDQAVLLDYNGQVYYLAESWSLSGNQITILFADPYVTDYDAPPKFHVQYPY